jgi:hypothetical protein
MLPEFLKFSDISQFSKETFSRKSFIDVVLPFFVNPVPNSVMLEPIFNITLPFEKLNSHFFQFISNFIGNLVWLSICFSICSCISILSLNALPSSAPTCADLTTTLLSTFPLFLLDIISHLSSLLLVSSLLSDSKFTFINTNNNFL